MTRPTLQVGDVWDDALANAAGFPQLTGLDEYGHGPKARDENLDDSSDQIKARFYGFYDRLRLVAPESGRTVSYGAYTALRADGTTATYSASTITLPDNSSGFIYLNNTGAIAVGNALPEIGVHIANYTTSGGNVVALVDVRYQSNEVIKPISIPEQNVLQVGDIKVSARTTGGTGWIACNGASYATSLYPLLFAAIGTTYNLPGDNVGTFRVPNIVDRAVAQASTARPLGTTEGNRTVTLSTSQLPAHSHAVTELPHTHSTSGGAHSHVVNDPGHTHNLSQQPHSHGIIDPGHNHGLGGQKSANLQNELEGRTGAELSTVGGGAPVGTDISGTNISIRTATVPISMGGASTGISIQNANLTITNAPAVTGLTLGSTGGGQAVNIMSPTIYLNYFIRAF